MSIEDAFAVPKSFGTQTNHQRCRRQGRYVFVPKGADLPCRCIVCYAEVTPPVKKRRVYWHASGWYLLILVNILLYALVAAIVRKKALVSPAYCEKHAKARRLRIILFLVPALALMMSSFMFGFGGDTPLRVMAFIAGLLLLVFAIMAGNTVRAVHIDPTGVTLAGFKEPFLSGMTQESVGTLPDGFPGSVVPGR